MHVYTLVLVEAENPDAAVRAAHRVLPAAALRHGADYWTIGALQPRLHDAGFLAGADTGAIPLQAVPDPLPPILDPAAVVTANGRWNWRPLDDEPGYDRWPKRLEQMIGPRVPGRWAVMADVHF
jgi:hypothetical protein